MSRYRKIDPRIWNDEKFTSFSDAGKLAFFFLLTHPHMTSLGAMRGTIAGFAAELHWTEKKFREAFREVLRRGMVKHDPKASFLWFPNFLKYNVPESPNVIKAWVSVWDLLPECPLKDDLFERIKAFAEGLGEGFGEAFREAFGEAFPHAFGKPCPNQEQEQEQQPEQEKKISTPHGVLVRANGAEHALPPCPHKKLIALYRDCMPGNPPVRSWNETRKRLLQTRWRECAKGVGGLFGYQTEEEGLAKWREFFEICNQSPFLTGQVAGRNDSLPFLADLEWLIRPRNFAKVIENRYHRNTSS